MTTIGEYFDRTRIRGINEGIGRDDIVQSFHGTPADGGFELPVGPKGPDGPQGPPAYPFRHEGDVADGTALNALATELRPAHAGKAWRVVSTNRLMIWNGQAFDMWGDAFGAHGPAGETNILTLGTVTTGTVGGDAEVTITGDPPTQTVNLTIPRGVKGAKGPIGGPGPLRGASDYDNTVTHTDRMVPLWNDATAEWTPTPYPGWRGPWTVVEAQAWDGSAGFAASVTTPTTSSITICQINLPAQDVRWRPYVTGGAILRVHSSSGRQTRLRARLGSASGQLVAEGHGLVDNAYTFATLRPACHTSGYTPDSTVGTVAPGDPAVIYLVADEDAAASESISYSRDGAHVAVWAVPVTGAPE